MIAGLLYVVGLIVVLVTVVMVGYGAPPLIQNLTDSMSTGTDGLLGALGAIGVSLAWSVMPFLIGLSMIAVARIITLLAAINRSLRGPA